MSDDPVFLRSQLNRLLGALGSQDADSVGGVFGDWERLVGAHVAAHVTPVKLNDGVLVVEVSEPAWATEVRFLERNLCAELSKVTTTPVTSIDVRVRRRRHRHHSAHIRTSFTRRASNDERCQRTGAMNGVRRDH